MVIAAHRGGLLRQNFTTTDGGICILPISFILTNCQNYNLDEIATIQVNADNPGPTGISLSIDGHHTHTDLFIHDQGVNKCCARLPVNLNCNYR